MSLIEFYLRAKYVWNRGNSHVAFPKSVIEFVLLMYLVLKADGSSLVFWIPAICALILFSVFALGFLDLYFKIADRENSMTNQNNPELMTIVRGVPWKKK